MDPSEEPVMTFPEEEAAFLKETYKTARVILEYGSGGSTFHAAGQPGKYVMSVESDRLWATKLQRKIDAEGSCSPVVIYYSDIGPTAEWGRPVDETHWRSFSHYPTHVWAQPFFRDPDLVLIDGRMRAACFVATFLRIKKPTTVLFDDYIDRDAYQVIEKLASPVKSVGRMAKFQIEPGERAIWMHDLFMDLVCDITIAGKEHYPYSAHAELGYPFSIETE
jgi:hypothetical protein